MFFVAAVDCVVGEWEEYGDCSRQCGLGAKTRHRTVIQEPRNGGQECPVLKETTVCFGERCMRQRHIGRKGRVDLGEHKQAAVCKPLNVQVVMFTI